MSFYHTVGRLIHNCKTEHKDKIYLDEQLVVAHHWCVHLQTGCNDGGSDS